MVQASLNRPLDIHPFAALTADERFDNGEAAKDVSRTATRTAGAAHFRRREFHQPCAREVYRNGIDYRAARVAFEIHHVATFLDEEAAVAIRASGDLMRDDQIAAFVLMHKSWARAD